MGKKLNFVGLNKTEKRNLLVAAITRVCSVYFNGQFNETPSLQTPLYDFYYDHVKKNRKNDPDLDTNLVHEASGLEFDAVTYFDTFFTTDMSSAYYRDEKITLPGMVCIILNRLDSLSPPDLNMLFNLSSIDFTDVGVEIVGDAVGFETPAEKEETNIVQMNLSYTPKLPPKPDKEKQPSAKHQNTLEFIARITGPAV